MSLKKSLVALSLFVPVALAAAPATAPNRAAIEAIVHNYIITHPEVITEAVQVLEARKQAKAIGENRATIEAPWGHAWEGDPHGDVTLVEFFDYNCGYCRASVADVKRLLAEDKHLKVVYREIPVLGAESVTAAISSLALATKAGPWPQLHRAIYAGGDASPEGIATAAKASGFALPSDADLKAAPIQGEIESNRALAQRLGFGGTPSWVVGDRTLDGAVGYHALKAAIADARRKAH